MAELEVPEPLYADRGKKSKYGHGVSLELLVSVIRAIFPMQ